MKIPIGSLMIMVLGAALGLSGWGIYSTIPLGVAILLYYLMLSRSDQAKAQANGESKDRSEG